MDQIFDRMGNHSEWDMVFATTFPDGYSNAGALVPDALDHAYLEPEFAISA